MVTTGADGATRAWEIGDGRDGCNGMEEGLLACRDGPCRTKENSEYLPAHSLTASGC